MTLMIAGLVFWAAAWALNVRLSHSALMRVRAGRLVVPAIFGITILVVWECLVRRRLSPLGTP